MLSWFKKKLGRGEEEPTPTAPPLVEQTTEEWPAPEEEAVQPSAAAVERAEPAPTEAPAAAAEPPPAAANGFFNRLRQGLSRTRENLVSRMDELFLGKKVIDAELFDELEEILITADLGTATTHELLERAREQVKRDQLSDPKALEGILQQLLQDYLVQADRPAELVMPASGPFVIMVLGVNGVGKTTTIGKLAYKFKQAGQQVLLVAADTFRAAAIEQLQAWGQRVDAEVIAQQQGADPSSVIYDAFDYARPRNFDVIIVDTAGRLHTKVNLMEELRKIKRVMNQKIPGAPHEVMLVIDATTGQNGISQARLFHEAVEVSGIALTKLDGTSRGGIVVNICREFKIPIRFVGIGEQMEDLRDFEPREFVKALFTRGQDDNDQSHPPTSGAQAGTPAQS
ncbi:signal recognition particle-docking protein FtsY [Desulfurivibrio alkaliphilus]|uniref:Signal recognition particle receptor FtsY n=1 Tax=Desulfurivibrio alkaliphilus (strain DSM 19089 / UNIQEM U267 / AHT2) TaxID=589865 RepID=D6Z2I4_DESAT|nr:signal recognition particle-docking protein FtsY [Desulfurivibrio alkaliphilus]ADH85759.1 signal recognition particle-docking protein FtsY [Desulfurivibrio alkaliphilus AHT 2]